MPIRCALRNAPPWLPPWIARWRPSRRHFPLKVRVSHSSVSRELSRRWRPWRKNSRAIPTARCMAASSTLAEVKRQVALLQEKSIAQRRQIVGLEPKRADVIFAGAYLLEKIMDRFGASQVIVSDQGVRYGLLHEAAKTSLTLVDILPRIGKYRRLVRSCGSCRSMEIIFTALSPGGERQ